MQFEHYFIAASYSLFTISFVMLAATRQVDPVAMILYAGVLIAGWLIDRGAIIQKLAPRTANVLLLCYLPVAFVEWQIFGSSPVTVIIHFILFASSLKLLRIKNNRDWIWLYIVSFCQVLMSAGMMIGAPFFLMLIVYLFAAILTFMCYEIRRSKLAFAETLKTGNMIENPPEIEYWREEKNFRRPLIKPRWRSLSYFSALILFLIILLAIPIFLMMPRLTRGFSRNGLLATEMLSGFSDTVRLGDVAQVKLNPQVVMRVRVRHTPQVEPRPLRWRGVTLDYYDGRTWSESGRGPELLTKVAGGYQVDEKRSTNGFTHQRFFMGPLNISTVFVAPRAISVTGLPELSKDAGDGLWTEPHLYHKIEYNVYSDTSAPSDFELSSDNTRFHPNEIRLRYLQLPADFDRRISDLAAEVTRAAGSQLEIARRIENHLRTNYAYSLSLQRVEEGDPVADFLFNVRSGHCEYFASAMVLMLRSRRIPARLVNGFQMGEYNESADVYTVRQSDAHSWVEVYFPKNGWVAFDPTPPAGLSVYDNGLMAWFRHNLEAMEMFWLENVVGFDTGKQISMAISVQRWLSSYQRNASSRWFDWVADLAQSIESWREKSAGIGRNIDGSALRPSRVSNSVREIGFQPLIISLIALAGLAGAGIFWRSHRRSWRRRIKDDSTNAAAAFYQEMLRTLERSGLRKDPHQTPLEFAAKLGRPKVDEITNLYHRARFGNYHLTDEEIARVDNLLKELNR